ncbi:MAG: DUF5688 family protein, partial [Lachnospiraceae bacterium]|nr:DUF5688 family protein [Lachnospiraceae bacterium]
MEKNMRDDFKKFCDDVAEYLRNAYVEATVSLTEVIKNNGLVLTGVNVKFPETNAAPTFYLDKFFDEGKTTSEVVEFIKRQVSKPRPNIEISFISDWSLVKNKIRGSLLNAELNKVKEQRWPYRRISGDLNLFYKIVMEVDDDGEGSIQVSNELMKIWNVSEKDLFDAFCENDTFIGFESILEILGEMMGGLNPFGEEEPPLYVLTNKTKCFGASVIANPAAMHEMKEEIMKKCGDEEFYVIPSSVHELLLIPKKDFASCEGITSMIKEINATQLAAEEVLSDHPYI